jgi:hypothetical protein
MEDYPSIAKFLLQPQSRAHAPAGIYGRRLNFSQQERLRLPKRGTRQRGWRFMERETTVHCSQCHRAIVTGEGFVRFKVPGTETYQYFHYRFRLEDCWEGRLNERK